MIYTHLGWFEHKDGRWYGYLAVAPCSVAYEPDKVYATVEGADARAVAEAHGKRSALCTADARDGVALASGEGKEGEI